MKVAIVIYDKFDLENFAKFNDFFVNTMKFDVGIYSLKEEVFDKNGVCVKVENHSQSLFGSDIVTICDGDNEYMKYDQIFLSWISSSSKAKYRVCSGFGSDVFKMANVSSYNEINNDILKEELLKLF